MMPRRGGDRVTKLYLDSRMSLDDGSIQIPGGGIQLDPSNRVWLAEFSTVASWDTIDNSNNSFFMVEKLGGAVQNRIVTVPNGPYDLDTLAASLQSRLNSGKLTGLGTYFVTRVGTSESAASGAIARAYQVDLSSGEFQIPSDVAVINGSSTPMLDPRSMSRLFSFPSTGFVKTLKSNFVDLRRAHQLFLHTPGFGNYNTLGPSGERNILAKIPVDAGYGGAIHYYMSGAEHEAIECGVNSLSVIKIVLKDVEGREIDPKGGHWSGTLIFDN
jgi:hypothetical protein